MSDHESSKIDDRCFPTTAWNILHKAQDGGRTDQSVFRNEFLVRYWKPVFYYLRAKRYPNDAAEELTQEFFVKFLDKEWYQGADQQRGRFRTYLLTILNRFLSDQKPVRLGRQKVFDRQMISISGLLRDEDRAFEPAAHETPEAVFMKQWAINLIGRVKDQLQAVCEENEKRTWFHLFLLANEDPAPTQSELIQQFALSRDQVRYALSQTKTWFKHILRTELCGESITGEDVEEEVRELLSLIIG